MCVYQQSRPVGVYQDFPLFLFILKDLGQMNSHDNQAFPLFNEKLVADQAKLISWCPTADLVLLVSPTNVVSLYRVGVTKIWSFDHEKESIIKHIAWKPNGKFWDLRSFLP